MNVKSLYGLFILLGCFACNSSKEKISNQLSAGVHAVITSNGGKVLLKPYPAPDTAAQQSFIYFHLSIQPPNQFVKPVGKEFTYYVDFDIQNHLQLLQGSDTLRPVICQRVSMLQANQYEYEVIFDRIEKGTSVFMLQDEMLGVGSAAITLTETELN